MHRHDLARHENLIASALCTDAAVGVYRGAPDQVPVTLSRPMYVLVLSGGIPSRSEPRRRAHKPAMFLETTF